VMVATLNANDDNALIATQICSRAQLLPQQ
jgi:hypothetical protein